MAIWSKDVWGYTWDGDRLVTEDELRAAGVQFRDVMRNRDGERHLQSYKDGSMRRDENGVLRWVSNDGVPPAEVIGVLRLGAEEEARHDEARTADMKAFIADYRGQRAKQGGPSPEEIFEARAAHGPGQTLVNVFTGERIMT